MGTAVDIGIQGEIHVISNLFPVSAAICDLLLIY